MRFERLIHSDWSMRAEGRWCAQAVRSGGRWVAGAPEPVGELDRFNRRLCEGGPSTLAGFDFPIGLPHAYGLSTGLAGFRAALERFGTADWADFYRVAREADDVSTHRPFYPNKPGGRSHRQLLDGLGVTVIGDLLRACERAHGGRSAASPLFWTMGAKQVGKAAIVGWRDVLAPCVQGGCALWPFDGPLDVLSGGQSGGAVLAETYPAEAYGHVGVRFGAGMSKTRPSDRAGFARALREWAASASVELSAGLSDAITDGFGTAPDGSDRFDAVIGLLGMIEVVEGRRPEAPVALDDLWEGWILGQAGA